MKASGTEPSTGEVFRAGYFVEKNKFAPKAKDAISQLRPKADHVLITLTMSPSSRTSTLSTSPTHSPNPGQLCVSGTSERPNP